MSIKKYILLIVLVGLSVGVRAQMLPEPSVPPRLVNDFAGVLDAAKASSLESKLVAFDDSTGNQLAVITVKSLNGYDISDYTIKTFQKWKIGQAKKNNGILILLSMQEHKIWITVGQGLEPVATDAMCRRIIETIIIPRIKNGQLYEGLDEGTTALMQLAQGEFHEARAKPQNSFHPVSLIFWIVIVLFIVISAMRRRGQHISSGSNAPFWFFLGSFFGSGNDNFFGGGSSGSGNSGGSDFGGFSGGDSGGGGAGGDW